MGEPVWHSDPEEVETLSNKYLCDTGHNVVEDCNPLQQNTPRGLKCLYLGHDACASVDRRTQEVDGCGGGAE